MSTPVFCGLGAVAYKYYMLFQHQSVPSETSADEPSWLLGAAPGPFITELSRSVYLSLGKNVAFLGLDCRTERTVSCPITLLDKSILLTVCSGKRFSLSHPMRSSLIVVGGKLLKGKLSI